MLTKSYMVLSISPFAIINITYFWHFHAWKGVNHCVPITGKTALLYSQFKSLSKSKQKNFCQNETSKFFMIWKFKSSTLEVWRWMTIFLLGIYSDIILHANDLGSKHPIDQFTYKNFKSNFSNFDITFHQNDSKSKHPNDHLTFKNFEWNFFNFDITKVAW